MNLNDEKHDESCIENKELCINNEELFNLIR